MLETVQGGMLAQLPRARPLRGDAERTIPMPFRDCCHETGSIVVERIDQHVHLFHGGADKVLDPHGDSEQLCLCSASPPGRLPFSSRPERRPTFGGSMMMRIALGLMSALFLFAGASALADDGQGQGRGNYEY